MWDGRLDNREDLAFDMGESQSGVSDALLVSHALDRWGTNALAKLIGDWSLTLWDPSAPSVTLASDYAGVRPLFYSEQADSLHWSTSLAELTLRLGVREHLDDRFALGYLTGLAEANVSPYRGISSVPAGHAMTWSMDGSVRTRRFWSLPHDELPIAAGDVAPEFRRIFASAVRARLRTPGPVWAELSGGLDSSAVVCMARLCLMSTGAVDRLRTVSCISSSSSESDERRFVEAVVGPLAIPNEQLVSEHTTDAFDSTWGWVSPVHPSGRALAMFRLAEGNGSKVLLSGRLGDVVMMNTPEATAAISEALEERDVRAVISLGRQWCLKSRRTVWDLASLLVQDIWPRQNGMASAEQLLMPFGVDTTRPVAAAKQAYHLSDALAARWVELARCRTRRPALAGVSAAKRAVVADILDSTEQRWLQAPAELAPVSYAHPYADRRLVEFMLRLPARVTLPPGEPRALMKSALRDILPARILARFSKGFADPLNMRTIRRRVLAGSDAVASWEVVRRGYIDARELSRSFAEIRNGGSRKLKNLLMVVNLERWLSQREDRTRSATG